MFKKVILPIIFLVLFIGGGAYLLADKSEFKKVDMSEYSIMDVAHLDDELQEFVDKYSERKGIKYTNINGNAYAIISAGTIGSGSGVVIEEVLKNNSKYKVNYSINEVKDDEYKENIFVLIKFKGDLKLSK